MGGGAYRNRSAVGNLEGLHWVVRPASRRCRQNLPIRAAGGVDSCEVAAPVDIGFDLAIHAIAQMQLTIYAAKNPERVFASRERGSGIERWGRLLLTNSWNQRAGKEIPRWSEEAGDAEVCRLQGPGIVAAGTVQRQRRSGGAAANQAGQVSVEKVVSAKHDSSASVARQSTVVADSQRLSSNPMPIFKFINGDCIFAEHQHAPRVSFENGGVEDGPRL